MTKVINAEGLTQNGNSFTLILRNQFTQQDLFFNDVSNADITAENGKLFSARVISSKDDTVFYIKNLLDEYEMEKMKIYLNKTQPLDYSFDSENVAIEKMKTET